MRIATVLGLSVAALVAAACGPLIPTPSGSPHDAKQQLMADFDRNLATWQASGITRYAFTFKPLCFCNTTPHLVVADGAEVRIDGVAGDQRTGAPAGVPGLFDMVRRAIKGDRATIGYDSSTGVPTRMESDPIANAVDDEFSFSVEGWTLDPPDDRLLGGISKARRLWDVQGIQTYTWSIKIACDCFHDGRRYDITLTTGDLRVRSGGKDVALADLGGVPLTIPALFDLATKGALTAETTVAFDSERGFPTRVEIHDSRPDAVTSETITVVSFAVP